MKNLLICFEGSSASSSGLTPVSDMLETRFGPYLKDWRLITFYPTNRDVRLASKLIEDSSYNRLLIIGKSLGAIKVIKLLKNITHYNCSKFEINVITIDPHSPGRRLLNIFRGDNPKPIKLDSELRIHNFYQRNKWPKGLRIESKNSNNYLLTSNHFNIIYNIEIQEMIRIILKEG